MEEREETDFLNPPDGWFAYGSHVGFDGPLEFSEEVDPNDHLPLWERHPDMKNEQSVWKPQLGIIQEMPETAPSVDELVASIKRGIESQAEQHLYYSDEKSYAVVDGDLYIDELAEFILSDLRNSKAATPPPSEVAL